VDNDIAIGTPVFEGCPLSNGQQLITLDTATTLVEPCNDNSPGETTVGEPDFVFGEKPEPVMGDVKIAVRRKRAGTRHRSMDVLLYEVLPYKVRQGMPAQITARGRDGSEVERL
jgi:hypothetical protein